MTEKVIEEESEEIEKLINQQGKDPHKSVSSDKSSSSDTSRELSPPPTDSKNVQPPVAPPRKSPRTQPKVRGGKPHSKLRLFIHGELRLDKFLVDRKDFKFKREILFRKF